MMHLLQNKHWEISKEYNKEKLLYLLIDRPVNIINRNTLIWKNNKGQSHRNYDLPACVWHDGEVSWWKNSKLHRENNKSAVIFNDGYKQYWFNDKHIKQNIQNETFNKK